MFPTNVNCCIPCNSSPNHVQRGAAIPQLPCRARLNIGHVYFDCCSNRQVVLSTSKNRTFDLGGSVSTSVECRKPKENYTFDFQGTCFDFTPIPTSNCFYNEESDFRLAFTVRDFKILKWLNWGCLG